LKFRRAQKSISSGVRTGRRSRRWHGRTCRFRHSACRL
jgi:hypothetical protein